VPFARHQNTSENSAASVLERFSVAGVVAVGNQWRAAVKDAATNRTYYLREGDVVSGHRVVTISERGVVLTLVVGPPERFELRMGTQLSGLVSDGPDERLQRRRGEDRSALLIPDFANMGQSEREARFAHWREAVSALDSRNQEVGRAQVRKYWRRQWEGQWGEQVRLMSHREQEAIRKEISAYWRW